MDFGGIASRDAFGGSVVEDGFGMDTDIGRGPGDGELGALLLCARRRREILLLDGLRDRGDGGDG
jgi:hypothetical protein